MEKNFIERILLIGTLIQNILPYTWTIFLAYFYVYKKSLDSDPNYATLYFATALMRMSTFFARNIKASIHSMLGLKRTIQLTGLLILLNFFSFYKFPSLTCFYLNSLWLGLLNGILSSTVLTYIRDKQEASRIQADFYAAIAYYLSFIFWSITSLVIFNSENRPLFTIGVEGYDANKNRENFRTLMDVFGITAVIIIEGCTAFLEDPMKYNPAFQEWLNTKLNEEREEGDKIELNDVVTKKRAIGHLDDESISNVQNNRMDNRISGNTLFTTKKDMEDLVLNPQQNIEVKIPNTKNDKIFYEEELPISVSFLNPNKDESDNMDNYEVIVQNTINGQNFFLIFAVNTLRLVSLNFIGYSTVIIGFTVYDNSYSVAATLLLGIIVKLIGHIIGEHIPRFINLHKVYLLNIILNIGMSLIALNMDKNFTQFVALICLQKFIEGIIYSLKGTVGNYLYEFEKKEIAISLFELESVSSIVLGAITGIVFINGVDFQTLFKAYVGLDVIVLVLFFYLVSTRF